MSKTKKETQTASADPSISELELAVRMGYAMRSMLIFRKAGKLPPHFFAHTGRAQKQVRYFLVDVEKYEQSLKSKQ
jgi:hypothetical protein